MKLEQLRPNLAELPEDDAFNLFNEYYERRSEDMQLLEVKLIQPGRKKKASTPKKKKKKDEVTISPADLELLKKMGLC